jgi:hypothetical protein
VQALAASVTAAGYCCRIIWTVVPEPPDPAASEILAGSTPGFASWLTGSQEADLRLVTDEAGAARVLTMIVRAYGVLYYK